MGIDTIILPTHTCFDDALEIMTGILKAHPETLHTDEFVIVHAIVAPYGKDSSHAWIEDTHRYRCFFIGVLDGERKIFAADRAEYYAELKVKETTRYTFMEAYHEEKRTGQFGPWVEKYRRLCGDAHE